MSTEKMSENPMSEEDRKAALELAQKDRVLMGDEFTAAVIKNNGMTADGRVIEDLGNFLHERRKAIEEGDTTVSAGPKEISDAMITHSKKWEEKENS